MMINPKDAKRQITKDIKKLSLVNTTLRIQVSDETTQNNLLELKIEKEKSELKLIYIELYLMKKDTTDVKKVIKVTDASTIHIKLEAEKTRQEAQHELDGIIAQYQSIIRKSSDIDDKIDKYVKSIKMSEPMCMEIPQAYQEIIDELKEIHEKLFVHHESISKVATKLKEIEQKMENLNKVETLVNKYNKISQNPLTEKSEKYV